LPSIEELSAVLDTVLESVPHPIQVDDRKALLENALGLTCAEAENVFALSLVRHKSFSIESIRDVQQEKSNVIRKSGLLEFISAELTTEEIGGLDLLKSWLAERKRAFSEEAQAFGLPNPKGVLVVGVPGSGKSLSAKAISSAWNLPLLRFDIGKVFGSLVGQSEEQMRRALQLAETISPCILWIDELEKGMAGLQTSGTSDSGVTARVLGTFLTWMQEKTRPVFVFATANNVNALPPEMLRKGRFDELFYVDLPSEAERREILRIHLKKRRRNPETFDLVQLARECDGFGGAEIEQAIISGLYRAFSHKRDLQTGDILAAYRETKPLSQIMKAHIERIREWGAQHARPASSSMAESAGDDNKRRLVL
jgi:SpoVK/Ycf46/Vps4 family AAA+-type ATPase